MAARFSEAFDLGMTKGIKVPAIIENLSNRINMKNNLGPSGSCQNSSCCYSQNPYFQVYNQYYSTRNESDGKYDEIIYKYLVFDQLSEARKIMLVSSPLVSPKTKLAYSIVMKDREAPSCVPLWQEEWPISVWMKQSILDSYQKFSLSQGLNSSAILGGLKLLPFGSDIITRILISLGVPEAYGLFNYLGELAFIYATACWNQKYASTPDKGRESASLIYKSLVNSKDLKDTLQGNNLETMLQVQKAVCPDDRGITVPTVGMISSPSNVFSPCRAPLPVSTFFQFKRTPQPLIQVDNN